MTMEGTLPTAAEVERVVQRVLDRPEFSQPEPGGIERAIGWLVDRLSELGGWLSGLVGADGGLLQWLLIAWLSLSLLAITAHLVWSLRQVGGPPRRRAMADELSDRAVASPAELLARADRLAAEGRFERAMHVLYLGLLRCLDEQGTVRYEAAKTGGDYLTELPAGLRRAWRAVLAGFYPVAFGGRVATHERWSTLRAAADALTPGVPPSLDGAPA